MSEWKRPITTDGEHPDTARTRSGPGGFVSGLYRYVALAAASALLTWTLVSVRMAFTAPLAEAPQRAVEGAGVQGDAALGATASDARDRSAN